MPKFNVQVCRIGYGFRTIQVEAQSSAEAAQIAEDKAGNYEFSEKNSTYEVQGVEVVGEPNQEHP